MHLNHIFPRFANWLFLSLFLRFGTSHVSVISLQVRNSLPPEGEAMSLRNIHYLAPTSFNLLIDIIVSENAYFKTSG